MNFQLHFVYVEVHESSLDQEPQRFNTVQEIHVIMLKKV